MNNAVIDLAIRIKNGYLAKRETIESPHSKFREEVLKKLKDLNYIRSYKISGDKIKNISIELNYQDGVSVVSGLKIYSRPGRRWYIAAKQLRPVLGGLGISVISTPQGIVTNIEAKKKNIGGELLFDIW